MSMYERSFEWWKVKPSELQKPETAFIWCNDIAMHYSSFIETSFEGRGPAINGCSVKLHTFDSQTWYYFT